MHAISKGIFVGSAQVDHDRQGPRTSKQADAFLRYFHSRGGHLSRAIGSVGGFGYGESARCIPIKVNGVLVSAVSILRLKSQL